MICDSRFESQIAIAIKSRDLEHLACERFARIASILRFVKRGAQFANPERFARIRRFARICESIRANRAILGPGTFFNTFRESTNPLFLRGGGFGLGFLPIFCLKYSKNTPHKKKTGVTKTGVCSTLFGSPLTPHFLKGGGGLFWVFCLFFALSIGKTPQTKNGGYENGGLLTLELFLTLQAAGRRFEGSRGSALSFFSLVFSLRAKGALISEPRFSTPREMSFFPTRERENGLFKENPLTKAILPFSRGKNRISQGVENRGSLISAPLALKVFLGGISLVNLKQGISLI